MKEHTFHPLSGYRAVTAQMVDMFNNIVIGRYNAMWELQKTINVPCVQGNRSTAIKSLENINKTTQMPMISMHQIGSVRDPSKAADSQRIVAGRSEGHRNILDRAPVPMNIAFQMDIMARYQSDIDQILNNFVVFFNPSAYIVIPHPLEDAFLKLKVEWNGTITNDYSATTQVVPYSVAATTHFSVSAWMFPGNSSNKGGYDKGIRIEHINSESIEGYEQFTHDVPRTVTFAEYHNSLMKGWIGEEYIDTFPSNIK